MRGTLLCTPRTKSLCGRVVVASPRRCSAVACVPGLRSVHRTRKFSNEDAGYVAYDEPTIAFTNVQLVDERRTAPGFWAEISEVGSVEVGKRADLLLIDGDPVSDVMVLQRRPYVFKAGLGYRTQAVFDMLWGKVGLVLRAPEKRKARLPRRRARSSPGPGLV
jgi:hypothetical protein